MNIDYQKLEACGIKLTARVAGAKTQKMFCPKCHSTRKNKKDKSLSVDWDKCVAYCHHCNESFFFGETERKWAVAAPKPMAPITPKEGYRKPGRLAVENQPGEKMAAWFASRGIPAEVLQQEGITEVCRRLPGADKPEHCIVFPYLENGRLVNRKYRDGAKRFMLESGAKLVPWRIDNIRDTPHCIITEGEMDALSFIVAGRTDVISVPNGAQKNLEFLDEFVESHLENKSLIYIAADTDAKGMELRNELIRRLGEEKCRIVTYGDDCKDANELLQKSGVEGLRRALAEAQEVPLEGVFTAGDVKDELHHLFEKGMQRGLTLGMEGLDDLLSLEPGRLLIVTGIPGDGKSEFLDEMAVRLSLRHGWRCAFFSPENFPVILHQQKLVSKLVGKCFQQGVMSEMEFDAAVDYLSKNIFDILPEENFQVGSIMELFNTLVRRKGINVIFIDPYNCLEHQIPTGQSETQYINELLETLRNFARRRNVLVVLAAHPVKMKMDPLTKRFPVPTMYDISGSAAFFNKADFGISIERDRTRDTTRIHVQKVKFRHLGRLGFASMKYNTHNGRFTPFEEPKTPDLPDPKVVWDNSNWLTWIKAEIKKLFPH